MHVPSTHILPVSEDKVHSIIVKELKEKLQEVLKKNKLK
jgi:hypothetical protein